MGKYIPLDAVLAEIKRRLWLLVPKMTFHQQRVELEKLLSFLNTLEVKEVDLEKEIQDHIKECLDIKFPTTDVELIKKDVVYTAKKFFELGLNASNPIAEENLESFVRQVIDLDIEAGEHYNNIIKEERKENRGSDLMINLLCGTIDAKELGIQYVLNKLKAQKGE